VLRHAFRIVDILTRPAAAPRPLLDRTESAKIRIKWKVARGPGAESAGRCAGDCSWL